ncbi:hypothetical protein [Kordia sp.]|uniref:hypothetical protein n=1 Tax=Kordia sp. TaxID=1965332 RepID=UPI003D2C0D74
MKRNKKVLTFTKIRIANMNRIKGGGHVHTSEAIECESNDPKATCGGTRFEATVPENPCSDTCLGSRIVNSRDQEKCFRTF